jgi:hypothetical protein
MEIIHISQLPDGQPILTVREGDNIRKYTFSDDGLWYSYPDYTVINDKILFVRLTENLETVLRENLIQRVC